ncbi:hypothetical protein P7D15_01720 [Bacillus cereus]|uniref:hypothetical protein n=1 Tax=Bacillus cereus TaxID=1396 RepID=UPI002405EAF3|nr:hypothetical protein [Bacillus cereus]MDF9599134.1 hypothetical protein [Bacillus cereus]MDG1589467.1 hypothetical protein [Bacillus cereus]
MIPFIHTVHHFIRTQYPFLMWMIYAIATILLVLMIIDIDIKRITPNNKVRIVLIAGCVFFTLLLLLFVKEMR